MKFWNCHAQFLSFFDPWLSCLKPIVSYKNVVPSDFRIKGIVPLSISESNDGRIDKVDIYQAFHSIVPLCGISKLYHSEPGVDLVMAYSFSQVHF